MAFWCRIKQQSQLKQLLYRFERSYFQIHGSCAVNPVVSNSRNLVSDKPNCIIHGNRFEFLSNVRFFAAPVQSKPKHDERDSSGPRLNAQITSDFVRLVTDEGHSVVKTKDALEEARRLKLDLVEVQRHAKPPVCKIMDYHKEKYKQQIKEKDKSKSKPEVTLRKGDYKEVRFAGKIEQKDLQMKADTVKRLMERGYRVKCMAMGKEDQDLGGLLSRLSAMIEDVSIVESGPRVEKKQAFVIVRHVKFGPSKKGSGKKPSEVSIGRSADNKNATMEKPIQLEESLEMDEDNVISQERPQSIPSREKEQVDIAPDASSYSTNSYSNFVNPNPVPDGSRTQKAPSSPSEAPRVAENRYVKGPTTRVPNTKPMDVPGPNQARQPQLDLNLTSPKKRPDAIETDDLPFKNLKAPANELPKQQEPSRPSTQNPPASKYGIFGAQKADVSPVKQSTPAEGNRYSKPTPYNSSRNQSSNAPKSDGSGRAGADNGGQGKWGIFSSEK